MKDEVGESEAVPRDLVEGASEGTVTLAAVPSFADNVSS
jgi:hypothetical protein